MPLSVILEDFTKWTGDRAMPRAMQLRFIAEGQRYLEDLQLLPNLKYRYQKDVLATADPPRLTVPNLIAASNVYYASADGMSLITHYDEIDFRSMQPIEGIAPVPGPPVGWTEYALGLEDSQAFDETQPVSTYATDYTEGATYGDTGILLAPQFDQTYTVVVFGTFYSRALTGPSDTNFWSERYPGALVNAALMRREIRLRNSEGVQDYVRAINLDLIGLARVDGMRASANVGQMRG